MIKHERGRDSTRGKEKEREGKGIYERARERTRTKEKVR